MKIGDLVRYRDIPWPMAIGVVVAEPWQAPLDDNFVLTRVAWVLGNAPSVQHKDTTVCAAEILEIVNENR